MDLNTKTPSTQKSIKQFQRKEANGLVRHADSLPVILSEPALSGGEGKVDRHGSSSSP
jgi:hypothetical protein